MGNAPSTSDSNILKEIPLLEGKYNVPVVAHAPPKFEPDDPAALKYLDEFGYVVFKGASAEEATHAIDLFWTHLEKESQGKLKRSDPATWTDQNGFPGGFTGVGIMTTFGMGHAEWLWYLRGLPRVVKCFETIWGTDNLLTSFDGGGAFRPPEMNEQWATRDGWFHVDQNWRYKPTRVSVQGLLNLYPSGPHDGGLLVVPKSHKVFEELAKLPDSGPIRKSDFVKMTDRDIPELWEPGALKLCLEPGDLAMWDSRTTHCNHPATRQLSRIKQNEVVTLRRLVGYICMTPQSLAEKPDDLIKRRVQSYQQAQTSTHWPHEFHASANIYKSATFKPPVLNERQRQLLVGKDSTIDITQTIVVEKEDA